MEGKREKYTYYHQLYCQRGAQRLRNRVGGEAQKEGDKLTEPTPPTCSACINLSDNNCHIECRYSTVHLSPEELNL